MISDQTRLAQAWADNALIEIAGVPDICPWIVANAEKLGNCEHYALSSWEKVRAALAARDKQIVEAEARS